MRERVNGVGLRVPTDETALTVAWPRVAVVVQKLAAVGQHLAQLEVA